MSEFSTDHGSDAKPAAKFPFNKTHFHPPRKAQPGAVPTLFWPVVAFLLSVSVSLICWGAYNGLPHRAVPPMAAAGEKHLQQALFSSRFNPTSAEAPNWEIPELLPESALDKPAVFPSIIGEPLFLPPPAAEIPAPPPITAGPPAGVPKVELPKVELPVVETPLVLAPVPAPPVPPLLPSPPQVEIEPVKLTIPEPPLISVQAADMDPLVYRESTPGETPMLRNWKTLALCSLMTTAVFVEAPAPVAAGEKDKTVIERLDLLDKTIEKYFKSVQDDIKALKKEFENVKDNGFNQGLALTAANGKIKSIENVLDLIRADLEALRKREPAIGKSDIDRDSVDEIKLKLKAIELALLKLQPSTSRTAMSPPISSTNGRVMLVNLYPEELLFVVNQKGYRVLPGANVPLDNIPAGALNYEVMSPTWGLRARNTTTLNPNETFTLTAR